MHTETRDAAAVVDGVIRSRTTVRALRPDPVPKAQLVEIIEVARMAPSNFNTQPWRVHVLAAHARGLATCPHVSFVRYQSVIAEHLGLAPDEAVTCGMSLGHADKHAAVNQLGMPREPLEAFTRWLGFDE